MRTKLLHTQQSLAHRTVLSAIAVAVFSFLVSNAKVLGSFSPFGLSFCMAVPGPLTIFSFLGSILGYIVFGGVQQNAVYIAGLVLCAAVKLAFTPRGKSSRFLYGFRSIVAFASLMIVNIFYSAVVAVSVPTLLLRVAESVLCGCLAYMSSAVLDAVGQKKLEFNFVERASLAILSILLLMALSGIQVGGLNIARFIGAACIMVAVYRLGYSGGAVAAILFTIAMVLYEPSTAVSAGSFIISAFLAGVFKPFGKIGQAAVFLSASTFIGIVLGSDAVSTANLLEVLGGVILFMLIPDKVYQKFDSRKAVQRADPDISGIKEQLSHKLRFTAKTLVDLQESVQEVSDRMEEISVNDITTVYSKTCNQVCKDCGLNTFCWVTAYSDAMNALNAATRQLRNHGKLTRESSPFFFQQKCCQLDTYIQSINHNYKDYLARENAARRISEARLVAIEQFEGIANMLCEMSTELSEVASVDSHAGETVRQVFDHNGYRMAEAGCVLDRYGRMCIDVYLDEEPRHNDLPVICNQITDQLDREFELPSRMRADGRTKLSFFEKANLSVDFHAAQISNNNNKYCGDSFEQFMDSKGFVHLILSDGMGSGSHAALDSTMTCSIVHRLIKAGFGFESAFKLINLSFLVKSREESLATLDVCSIDLYTGEAEFIKAGAASSFVLRDKRVTKVESSSLPIGIIQGIGFDRYHIKLGAGDIVALVSDGALATGEDWLGSELQLLRDRPAEEIAKRLCSEAERRRIDGHSDDVTVLVAKINKAGK